MGPFPRRAKKAPGKKFVPSFLKKPNFMLDTEAINKQFTFGGEHGELVEEEANKKFE